MKQHVHFIWGGSDIKPREDPDAFITAFHRILDQLKLPGSISDYEIFSSRSGGLIVKVGVSFGDAKLKKGRNYKILPILS